MPKSITTKRKRKRRSPVREHILKTMVDTALKNPNPLLSQDDMAKNYTREAINRRAQDLLKDKIIQVIDVKKHNKKLYGLTFYGLLYVLKERILKPSEAAKVRQAFNIQPSHDNDLQLIWNDVEASVPQKLYQKLLESGIIWYEGAELKHQDLEAEGNLTLARVLIEIAKGIPSIKKRDAWISVKI